MKAVILAAGSGIRLKPLTNKQPKCLVQIKGKTIVDYQIEALLECNIDQIIIVVGYLSDLVVEYFENRKNIFLLKNNEYQNTNSIYSLWLAKKHLIGNEFILINGDVIINNHKLKELLPYKNHTVTLVDNSIDYKDGEMNLIIEKNTVKGIGKDISAINSNGESAQVTKFSSSDSIILFASIDKTISNGDVNGFPAQAYEKIISYSRVIPHYINSSDWFEIDTIEDYNHARNNLRSQ